MKPKYLFAAAVLAVAQALAAAPAVAQQPPKDVVVTPILSTTTTVSGQPIVLPQGDVEVVTAMYEVQPGATLPAHKHPYPRYGYMLSGNLSVTNLETGRTIDFRPGDVIVEATDQWHTARSTGSEPVKLLVIDLVEQDQGNVVLRE